LLRYSQININLCKAALPSNLQLYPIKKPFLPIFFRSQTGMEKGEKKRE
jgi:hypothetical protein